MSVRIGKIELSGVQDLHTEEARTLVEQRVPEQQGSVFQDLGREPVTILIDGLLFGEESLSALETLRQAHAKAEPQSFAADLVVGTDLTDVIIEDFSSPGGGVQGPLPFQPAPARTHRSTRGQ
jgi:hypothetical protein